MEQYRPNFDRQKRWRFATMAIHLPQQVVTMKAGLTSATLLIELYQATAAAETSRARTDGNR
jgi:hypothetical protein